MHMYIYIYHIVVAKDDPNRNPMSRVQDGAAILNSSGPRFGRRSLSAKTQSPGRIQKVDPPILESNTPMV